jgi:hypothetical protein
MHNFEQQWELSVHKQELSEIVLFSSCAGILSQSPFDLSSRVFFVFLLACLDLPSAILDKGWHGQSAGKTFQR